MDLGLCLVSHCQGDWINHYLQQFFIPTYNTSVTFSLLPLGTGKTAGLPLRGVIRSCWTSHWKSCALGTEMPWEKKELIRIGSLWKNYRKSSPNRETLTYPGDMALVAHQGHSIHPLGKHGTSLHGSVACRSQQDTVPGSWIQEGKNDLGDTELLRVHQWALGSGPYWHSNTCSSKYRNTHSLFQEG